MALVKYKNKYLIGKRSSEKKFAPDTWEFISGFVEEKETAEDNILKELKEEVNLTGRIIKSPDVYSGKVKEQRWIVIPFLIEADSDKLTLNKEDHSDLKWVSQEELVNYSELKDDVHHFKQAGLFD